MVFEEPSLHNIIWNIIQFAKVIQKTLWLWSACTLLLNQMAHHDFHFLYQNVCFHDLIFQFLDGFISFDANCRREAQQEKVNSCFHLNDFHEYLIFPNNFLFELFYVTRPLLAYCLTQVLIKCLMYCKGRCFTEMCQWMLFYDESSEEVEIMLLEFWIQYYIENGDIFNTWMWTVM